MNCTKCGKAMERAALVRSTNFSPIECLCGDCVNAHFSRVMRLNCNTELSGAGGGPGFCKKPMGHKGGHSPDPDCRDSGQEGQR